MLQSLCYVVVIVGHMREIVCKPTAYKISIIIQVSDAGH